MNAHSMQQWLRSTDPVMRTGRVRKILSTYLEADGPAVALGTLCEVEGSSEGRDASFLAEIVKVDRKSVTLSPLEDGRYAFIGARVKSCGQGGGVPAGSGFLGRAIDAMGRPLDEAGPIYRTHFVSLHGRSISPLERCSPADVLETGIRAIDGLLTLGKGQRIGIFAASGVGKTSLMGQIARQAQADITIMCLVGERGREVETMWNRELDASTRARSTLVAATSDHSAALRARAGHYAMALAEYWRSQGKHVLFLMDSVTRLAMAMREIGLAAGEPPTVRAYTPGVFAAIPKLVERAGALKSGGAITAIMTVLSENDEMDDPVCEMMKSLLDGHILLSRELSERGMFPAIDVSRSISRQAESLADPTHRAMMLQMVEWLGLLDSSRAMIDAGLYAAGSNKMLDRAIGLQSQLTVFLRQGRDDNSQLPETINLMARLVEGHR